MGYINGHQIWGAIALDVNSQARRTITRVYREELRRDPTIYELKDVLWRSGAYVAYEAEGYRPLRPLDTEHDLRDELRVPVRVIEPEPGPGRDAGERPLQPPADTPESDRPLEPVVDPPRETLPVALDPITVSGRIFTVGREPFDWREVSAFTLQKLLIDGRVAEATDFVRTMKQHGVNVFRVIGELHHPAWEHQRGRDWRFGPWDTAWGPALDQLCRLLSAEGVYLRYTLFDSRATSRFDTLAKKIAFAARVTDVLAPYPGVVVEVANEPGRGHTLFSTGDPDLATIARRLPSPRALGAEWGAYGHEDTYDRPPAEYVTFHAERRREFDGWNWPKRLGDYGVVNTGARPVVSAEPINAGDSGAANDKEPNSAIWAAYGALSRIVPSHGYAPCFHYDGGLFCERPNAQTTTCLEAFMSGCDAVPLRARMLPWTNGQQSRSPWRGYSQTDPPSPERPFRIYGRGTGAAYIGVAIRHRPGWSWPDLRYPLRRVAEWHATGGGAFSASVWVGQ